MKELSCDFETDINEEAFLEIYDSRSNYRSSNIELEISPNSLSDDSSEWLQVLEAHVDYVKGKPEQNIFNKTTRTVRLLRIRIYLPKQGHGATVTIRSNPVLDYKICNLRMQIRNRPRVFVTFPELYVIASKYGAGREIQLIANDFSVHK